MHKEVIQRQYDEVIAHNYDVDPQGVMEASTDRALDQLDAQECLKAGLPTLRVLDLGMGTGLFLSRLMRRSHREIDPSGLDLSQKMVEIARQRIPGIEAVVGDAANFDEPFEGSTFDMVCTHFVTGFVPMTVLAPKIYESLEPGGYWSFIGGTSRSYPALQNIGKSRLLQMFSRAARDTNQDDLLTPEDSNEVNQHLTNAGFEVEQVETFEPELRFDNFKGFMEFAYHGGWLTPFVEELGLQNAGWLTRKSLDTLVFPVVDHHSIVLAVGRKPL